MITTLSLIIIERRKLGRFTLGLQMSVFICIFKLPSLWIYIRMLSVERDELGGRGGTYFILNDFSTEGVSHFSLV